MLSTLMRYDFKRLLKTILPLCGAVLLGSGLFSFVFWRISSPLSFEIYLMIPYMLLMFASVLVVIGGFVFCFVQICLYFQKSLMSDEGYLTFTLPVTQNQILLSKTVAGSVCGLLAVCALIAAFFIMFMGIENAAGESLTEMGITVTAGGMEDITGASLADLAPLILMSVLFGIVSVIQTVIRIYFAVTAGYCISKNHKVLGSIGFYILLNIAISFVSTFLTGFVTGGLAIGDADAFRFISVNLITQTVFGLAICVLLYWWMLKILKSRLNLT